MKSLHKQVTFRVFNGKGYQDIRCRPDRGRSYDEESVVQLTHCILKQLLRTFPGVDYKVVRVGAGRINIIPLPSTAFRTH